ncbi:Dicer-like protein 1 [Xylographa opegraphella]|nr:Dicer-like protein 1 [Xylographa opegraphella]
MATVTIASPLLADIAMPEDPDDQVQPQDTFIAIPASANKPTTPVLEEPFVPEGLDETDSEHDDDSSPRSWHVTEQRRLQNSIFSAWLLKRAEKTTKEEAKAVLQNADDEALSIRNLMAKQESNVIIGDPREYQIELFERAKKQDIIAVLDTGSGKTLIAVLLLKHIMEQELENRALGTPRRIAFFVVNCVTLVFQQFAVLECNLNQKIDRFCGDMNTDLWTKAVWDKHFQDNMAIVCTAEVLYNCLLHSFIGIDQISLLIFDEAHHAKKNHTYARIIKDFYIAEPDLNKRPKIFGMTASPVDAKVDVVQAARELETLLHCQIATTADISLLRTSISRPSEHVLPYRQLPPPYMTALCSEIYERFKDMEPLVRLLRSSKEATSDLGEWAADHLWSVALTDDGASKMEREVEQTFLSEKQQRPVEDLNQTVARVRELTEFVRSYAFPPLSFEGNSVSSKVIRLHEYLNSVFERPTDARCIVFVKQRYTARLLAEIFKRIGSPHVKLGLLIGTNSMEAGEMKFSVRQQVLTIMKFRKGDLNCLFATSIAEEGLDIPDCNTVIRFDLCATLIQYIQSRGRARHKNSKYVHMIEQGNRQHAQAVKDVRDNEDILQNFCEALPADRLLLGNDYDLEEALAKERTHRTYTEPTTGAKLTYRSSIVILAHFVGSLPHDHDTTLRASYVMSVESKQYVCEVILPEFSPIVSVVGRPSPRKAIAKCSAAFEACLRLRKGGYLDSNLLPIYHKQLPAMRNAQLALGLRKTNVYDMRVKPDVWKQTWGAIPTELYMTVLDVKDAEALGRQSQPLALLTRFLMSNLPSFPLHLRPGIASEISCKPLTNSIKLTDCMMGRLTSFTLRIYKDIFNKTYETNEPSMSYWLAPLIHNRSTNLPACDPRTIIDWAVMDTVHKNEEIPWTIDTPVEDLSNRYLVDRWDGGRRFFSIGVAPGLNPGDPVPEGCAAHKYMDTILDYTVSLFSKSRARATWRKDQPVLLAHRVLHRRNWLDDWSESEQNSKTISYLCPEPLKFSAVSHRAGVSKRLFSNEVKLPTTVAATGYLLPAIIFRLEAYLIVLEACTKLGLIVKPELALEALTKDSDNTEEHRTEQVHFQRGMGKNYERLEFIGDCFLKMATSVSLYAQNAGDDEFESHVKRMLMICNANLFNVATQVKLYEYIRTQGFSRRTWYPEGIKLLEGKGHKKTGNEVFKHHLNDKTIADVSEALIGASLLSYNDTGDMDMAVKAVTVFVSSSDHAAEKWDDYYKLYQLPAYQTAASTAWQVDLAVQVERAHSYHFRYPRLLHSAFTHPSYPCGIGRDRIPSYQRLEFLGDSLLDMVCVSYLFYRYPDRDPQWLTEHKMAMVSNKFLGALSVKLGFHKHLRLLDSSHIHQIQEYVLEITEAYAELNVARDYWTTTKNPPKCLPDIVESYIGAIFVDSEFDYKEVERFFEDHVRWYFEDMSIYDTFANCHPTTFLSNLLTLNFGCTNYRLMSNELPSIMEGVPARVVAVVMIHNEIITDGEAVSSRYAKLKASSKALELLTGLAPFEYRIQYRCDCSDTKAGDRKDVQRMEEIMGSAI